MAQKLYLDLLKNSLLDNIYGKQKIVSAHGKVERNATMDEVINGKYWPERAHTMIGLKRLNNIQFCMEQVLKNKVPGDFIETGVWRGGATIFMKGLLNVKGIKDRKVFVADSFQGLPPPDPKYVADKNEIFHHFPVLAVSKETVANNFKSYNLLDNNVVFIKGFFEHSLKSAPINKLAVLRLDGDLYSSTIQVLEQLYDKVSPGGFIIVDDFALPGCKKAIEDFRKKRNINDPIKTVDWTCVFWQKSGKNISKVNAVKEKKSQLKPKQKNIKKI